MQTAEFSPDLLRRLHRFAALLTGGAEAGAALLRSVLSQCGGQMEQFRRERQGLALLVKRLRDTAGKTPVAAAGAGSSLAQAFPALPEPQRSALALLYTGLLPLPEIASVLGLSVDELCEKLSQARIALDAAWRDRPKTGDSLAAGEIGSARP